MKYHKNINMCKYILSYVILIDVIIFYYDLRYSNTCINICMYRQVYEIGTNVTTNNIDDIILYYLSCTNINIYVCIKLIIMF